MSGSKQKSPDRAKADNNFFDDVYDVVRQIPSGRATSYGAIAAYLGSKRGARMVGWALSSGYHQNDIPAHRVVNKAGILSAKNLFETQTTMQERLEKEGVKVKDDQIQNWDHYFWDPEKELS